MMELESFPEELRRRALEVGQVLRMEMFPEDSVRPKKGKSSKEKRFVIIGKNGDEVVAALLINSEINDRSRSIFQTCAKYCGTCASQPSSQSRPSATLTSSDKYTA